MGRLIISIVLQTGRNLMLSNRMDCIFNIDDIFVNLFWDLVLHQHCHYSLKIGPI